MKRRKGEQRQGCCVYCGYSGLITTDHVVPKLLFEDVNHSSLRVDACHCCQVGKGRGAQNLWKLVNIDIEGERHPVAAANLQRILRDELRIRDDLNRTGPVARAAQSRSIVNVVSESGELLGQAAATSWRLEPALNTLRYTARGLYYHCFGTMLDPYAPVEAAYIPYEARQFVRSLLGHMAMEEPLSMPTLETGASELVVIPEGHVDDDAPPIIVPDAVAVIVPFRPDDDDLPAALWALVFNRAVTFLVGTENYAAVVRNIHETLNDPNEEST